MENLSKIGRIFFGFAMGGMGIQTVYYKDFPYLLIPPKHSWIPGLVVVAYVAGTVLILSGACIVFDRKTRTISLLLGSILLLIFCFYYIPYEFMSSSNYMHLVQWENAEKELALCGGALVIAGSASVTNENLLTRFLQKLIPLGAIFFAVTIISFGILHFLYAKDASTLIPSWIPDPLFWTYLAGIALIGAGVAIILKIKSGPIAALLGTMIFIWFIILHIPRVMASPIDELRDEVTSAFLALGYSGIAFVIGGTAKKRV